MSARNTVKPRKRRLRGGPAAAFFCLVARASASDTSRYSSSRVSYSSNAPSVKKNDIRRSSGSILPLDFLEKRGNEFHRLLLEDRSEGRSRLGVHNLGELQHDTLLSRRLGKGIHEKGKSYEDEDTPTTVVDIHNKGGNKFDEDGSVGMTYMAMNSSPRTTAATTASTLSSVAAPEPHDSASQQQQHSDTMEDFDASATNVLPFSQFTRISGPGSKTIPLPTDRLRYPYMASFQIEGHNPSTGSFDYHVCAGILVAPDMVMTAAHCAYYSPPGTDETYQAFNGIEIGRPDLSDEGASFDPYSLETYRLYYEKLLPKTLHIHPDYNSETYEHDIMLVKVYGKSRYPPATLNSNSEATFEGGKVSVLGWGATGEDGSKKYSDVMREMQMRVMSKDRCERTNVAVDDPVTGQTLSTSLQGHIFDDMLCSYASDSYLCYGDAGGPVVHPGEDAHSDVVLGVISWGFGCVNSAYPAVSTRVADHYDWIRDTICNDSSNPPDEYECPGEMEQYGGKTKQTVTLKLRLDMMAVETGWVIETHPGKEVVAYRGVGYYKSDENVIVEETFELDDGTCYSFTGLDSFGDGWCCDMGGGKATLFLGTDTGFYSGQVLAEINGNFEYSEDSAIFCLNVNPADIIQPNSEVQYVPDASDIRPENNSPEDQNQGGSTVSEGPEEPKKPQQSGESNNTGNSGSSSSGVSEPATSGWSGPATNPEYEYCTQFCVANSIALTCGKYECYHSGDLISSDSQEEEAVPESSDQHPIAIPNGDNEGGQGDDSGGDFQGDSEGDNEDPDDDGDSDAINGDYYLTLQLQFDDHPEEVSWVLYDLTLNEVNQFIDFDFYSQEMFANQLLNLEVPVTGPDAGEKNYAFTVYDKGSNGLCCEFGEGYYKVFLGDPADELELLGDSNFGFSSSYYFTLFESGGNSTNSTSTTSTGPSTSNSTATNSTSPTSSPTMNPTTGPTQSPTKNPTGSPTTSPTMNPTESPTKNPTSSPTGSPTSSPTTSAPTYPWEITRPERSSEIGLRWSSVSFTPPGRFTDIGGNQETYNFYVEGLDDENNSGHSLNGLVFSTLFLSMACILIVIQ